MKNLFLYMAISTTLFACNNSKTESQADETITTVSRIDDQYSKAIKDLNEDYTKNDFSKFEEMVSDSVKVYFNSTVPMTKNEWKELAQSHHLYFDSIEWNKNFYFVKTDSLIKEEKHETNTLKAGNIYTSVWYTWNGIGKTTHTKITNSGNIIFRWENNKIISARFVFDPTPLINEITATNNAKNKYKILTMKKLLLGITAITIFISCKNPTAKENTSTEQQTPAIEHIYKPTYTDNFKIGDQKNVLLAEQLHQAIFAKDFNKIGESLADTVLFNMEDGSTIKGKEAALEYMTKAFSEITIKIIP